MDNLSEYLADQIASLDEESKAEDLAEYAADREALLESVEQFYRHTKPTIFAIYARLRRTANKLPAEVVEGLRDSAAWSLDDCLSRLMIPEIPRMVSRALKLEPILIENGAADKNPYLGEATRCFLFGLFNASVALSRSALEQALSKKIPDGLQGKSTDDKLKTLIRTARVSVLKQATPICDLADNVRRSANSIIHGRTCKESEAIQVLQDTRNVLRALYGPTR